MAEKHDEEAAEREWGEAMRLALANGLEPHIKKLVGLIDLRFRSLGRRERERHQSVTASLARMEGMLEPLVSAYETLRRLGMLSARVVGVGGAVTGVALGVAKAMGYL